ncbi:MAG: ParB/RepB/Spo0J family partition protein [Acidobacteria bacterium]|nr:ParB/RepB/Spo0J family partition protein [Acidobacteriota bacterium]
MVKKFSRVVPDQRQNEIFSIIGTQAQGENAHRILEVPTSWLRPNPYQPRTQIETAELDQLAESIKAQGILQPLIARQESEQIFTVIAGHRRWKAAEKAGLTEVPVLVKSSMTDQDMRLIALVENLQRENLHPVDEVRALAELVQLNASQEQTAQLLSIPRSTLAETVRLMALGEDLLNQCREIPGLSKHTLRKILALPEHKRAGAVRLLQLQGTANSETPSKESPQEPRKNLFQFRDRTKSKAAFQIEVRFRKKEANPEELIEALEKYLEQLKKENVGIPTFP